MTDFVRRFRLLMLHWWDPSTQSYKPTEQSFVAAMQAAYLEGLHDRKYVIYRKGRNGNNYKVNKAYPVKL